MMSILRLWLRVCANIQVNLVFVRVCVCCSLQFLERMQLEYHAKASDRGVYVIGSCGFDSIPADLGVLYTQRQFKGRRGKKRGSSGSENRSSQCLWIKSLVIVCSLNRVKSKKNLVCCLSPKFITVYNTGLNKHCCVVLYCVLFYTLNAFILHCQRVCKDFCLFLYFLHNFHI